MYPPFSLSAPRFDQSTFSGRLRHFFNVIDPRTLLVSKEKLQHSINLIENFKDGNLDNNVTDKQLWEALKIKQAIIHPDTGQKIPMPFRMSGFVVFGSPIVVGLLIPGQSFGQMIFWQWLNQTHNACVNYSNRNASIPTPTSRFVVGYVGAVSSAVSIAVGLSALIKRANSLSPAMKILIQRFVPFPAVAAASSINVVLMRNGELSSGINVVDKAGNNIGSSKVAAKQALISTAISRMVLPAPILVIPPAIMSILEKSNLLRRRPGLHLPFNATLCTLCFGLALPFTIALFPQTAAIPRSELEEEIQKKTSEETLYYNKGL